MNSRRVRAESTRKIAKHNYLTCGEPACGLKYRDDKPHRTCLCGLHIAHNVHNRYPSEKAAYAWMNRHPSAVNDAIVAAAVIRATAAGICDGSCEPRKDVFTYDLWATHDCALSTVTLNAQVRKGQKAIAILTNIIVRNGHHAAPQAVYCRHQVAALGTPVDENATPSTYVTPRVKLHRDADGRVTIVDSGGLDITLPDAPAASPVAAVAPTWEERMDSARADSDTALIDQLLDERFPRKDA